MFNSHVHTNFSKDCSVSCEDMCIAAMQKGLKGFSVTDHCDLATCITDNSYSVAVNSAKEARKMAEKYEGKLDVCVGVEIGESLLMPDYCARIIKAIKPDFVLASTHCVMINLLPVSLTGIDFCAMNDSQIKEVLKNYFDICAQTAQRADFDALAHLTLPFRYINGVHKRGIDIKDCYDNVKKVLSILIKKGKALELNTSELSRQIFDFMPNEEIIGLYKHLGGELITIGGDTHKAENIDFGIEDAKRLLHRNGFDFYVYYKERKPVKVSL